MTAKQYQRIQELAAKHLLTGGGVMPGDGECQELHFTEEIARRDFDATKHERAFQKAIEGLPFDQRSEIDAEACALRTAHQDASYVFGVAVGLQFLRLSMPPQRGAAKLSTARVLDGVR